MSMLSIIDIYDHYSFRLLCTQMNTTVQYLRTYLCVT